MSDSGIIHPLVVNAELGIDILQSDNGPTTDHPDAPLASKAYDPSTGNWYTKLSSGWEQDGAVTDSYTKTESDARYQPIGSYQAPETTIAGYGITDAYTKTAADARYLQLSGGTLTGPLTLGGTLSTGGNSIEGNPLFWSTSDSEPGGVVAAAVAVAQFGRVGTGGYSYNEAADVRIAHGGPSAYGTNMEVWVNGAANTSGVPDKKVATFKYNGDFSGEGNMIAADFVLS